MLISQKDFRDEELFDSKAIIEQAGIEVRIAAPEEKLAVGKLGAEIEPDLSIDDINVGRFEAIIFIGGPGAYDFIEDSAMHQLASTFFNSGKIVAAICIAPAILARAGLLRGRRATVHASGINFLQEGGAILLDQDVVVDKDIITANGPAAASAFGQEIVRALEKISSK